MASTEHLAQLGYVDPWEAAQRRAERIKSLSAELARAESLLGERRFDEARTTLQGLCEEEPDSPAPRQLSARLEFLAGRTEACFAQLVWLEEHGVEKAELALLRGLIELQRREFLAAQASAEYSRALDPSPAADVLLGRALLRRGRLEDAEAAFERALEQDARRADALAGLSAIALRRGDPESAADRALQSLDVDMSNPAVHLQLGLALVALGRRVEAEQAFHAAAKIDGDCAAAWRLAATSAAQAGDEQKAAACRRKGSETVRRRRARRRSERPREENTD
jgi:predicted Zn-dependent protease